VTPRLVSVWFTGTGGGTEFQRMAAVLEHTARRHNPGWDVRVQAVPPTTVRAATGSESHAANWHKLRLWRDAVLAAPEGAPVLLVDADTFVTGPLDPLWEIPFDVAFTARKAARFPLNGGVVAVRATVAGKRFMQRWAEVDDQFLHDTPAAAPWRRVYGGYNQASLGCMLASPEGARVVGVPCLVWNCEDTCWDQFDPAVTRVVHVKSALRMRIFGHPNICMKATKGVQGLAGLWAQEERGLVSACKFGADMR